jgi:hypothetical protein
MIKKAGSWALPLLSVSLGNHQLPDHLVIEDESRLRRARQENDVPLPFRVRHGYT